MAGRVPRNQVSDDEPLPQSKIPAWLSRLMEWSVRRWTVALYLFRVQCCEDGEGCGVCVPIQVCPTCGAWHLWQEDTNVCGRCWHWAGRKAKSMRAQSH